MYFLFGKMKGLWNFSHARGLSTLIEKIGELVGIWEQSRFVNPVPWCWAEAACIYICRGSRCFERSIQQTAQLIIPKSSRRATDDPSPTHCHRERAGVNQAARKKNSPRNRSSHSIFVLHLFFLIPNPSLCSFLYSCSFTNGNTGIFGTSGTSTMCTIFTERLH